MYQIISERQRYFNLCPC